MQYVPDGSALRWGVSPETAARDIVHFALIDANGPTGRFFRYKKPIQW